MPDPADPPVPDPEHPAKPARGVWYDYGRNLARRDYKLHLYLTGNPVIDAPMRAGFESFTARPAKSPDQPRRRRRGAKPLGKRTDPDTPDLFDTKPVRR